MQGQQLITKERCFPKWVNTDLFHKEESDAKALEGHKWTVSQNTVQCFLNCLRDIIDISDFFQMKLCISCCCCSVTKSRLTLCNPMECSAQGFPILHYLPMFAQIHVHWVSDATQPSDPLSLPFLPALNHFSALGSFSTSWLFTSGDQIISTSASSSVLPMNIQGWIVYDNCTWNHNI